MISKNKFSASDGRLRIWNLIMFSAIIFSFKSFAQQYPDTIWVPVTFYDFHSNSSNPEFEVEHNSGLRYNMIADTLNANRKPVLGTKPFFNYYIHKWFEPWKAGDFTAPAYYNLSSDSFEIVTLDHDTAFKNIVIQDSIPFLHIGDGVYQFERSGESRTSEFFWLDGRGFGNEKRSHNFSFTMELHTTFTYTKDLNFEFLGDDDVWAFINGKLAMDIGGIHNAEDGEIELDGIADSYGLLNGKKYAFDFFYAERHTSNSRIKITTNLFTPAANLRLYPNPGAPDQAGNLPIRNGDTIAAGEPFTVYGHAFDSLGWRMDWDSLVNLELIDPENRVKLISTGKGNISILPEDAYGTITIVATFKNPDDPLAGTIKTTLELFIGPGKAHHINIQDKPSISNWTDDDHRSSISIAEKAVLYAVVRDSLGNFVRFAENAQWSSENINLVTVTPENTKRYQGNLLGVRNGTTVVSASEQGIIPATIEVTVTSAPNSNDAMLDSAITRDVDGNGYLDRIDIYFNDTVILSNEAKNSISINYRGTVFEADSLKTINRGRGVSVFLKEKITVDLQTDWQPSVSILGVNGIVTVSDVVCKDGAGPCADKAKYYPGALRNEQNPKGTPDTIKATISELINWPATSNPNQIFRYYQKGRVINEAFSSMKIIDDSTALLIVNHNNLKTVETQKDSIQLISSSGLTDKFLNKPHPEGRKAPVEWGTLKFQFTTIKNLDNPQVEAIFKPVINKQNPGNSKFDPKNGTVVLLEVKGKPLKVLLDNRMDSAYGKVAVYDPVGNLIRSDLYVYRADGNVPIDLDGNIYGIYWDGLNQRGRYVGRGTYLFQVVTTDIDNKTNKNQFKIGVARR